jgi:PIN domain nuclease of toxin-antitoxin system
MRLLLDTHIVLWVLNGSRELKAPARRLIESASAVHVSAASVWEVAIKQRLGKITVDPDELVEQLDASGFVELPVLARHAAAVAKLPLHHHDPFDRLLVAQAVSEPLRLLTADQALLPYSELVTLV